jgi:GH15 family glucan-1,4-alpha-glucosidase
MQRREREAREMFEKLLTVCNDVGLLSEEYDPKAKILLGNFPQGLAHLSLVNSAHNLAQEHGPAHARSGRAGRRATESV